MYVTAIMSSLGNQKPKKLSIFIQLYSICRLKTTEIFYFRNPDNIRHSDQLTHFQLSQMMLTQHISDD